jgi:hypothetical protein
MEDWRILLKNLCSSPFNKENTFSQIILMDTTFKSLGKGLWVEIMAFCIIPRPRNRTYTSAWLLQENNPLGKGLSNRQTIGADSFSRERLRRRDFWIDFYVIYILCFNPPDRDYRAGIFKQSMGARNRVGIGLSYRPARLHRLAEFIPWNRFLGSINV